MSDTTAILEPPVRRPASRRPTRHVYDPASIEPSWQAAWEERDAFRTPSDPAELAARPKFYVLDMFPYPSGAGLHVGHPVGYTATDVVARFQRMRGRHVLHPMGWDAFGLPAERAAVREGLHPAVITRRNVDNFRRQIRRLGFSYDWRREIDTSRPEYSRWTQWIFLKLYERGLAYMAEMPVNWCPALGTVLANEEVHEGRYVETGDAVEIRHMRQWMLRITAYADRLLDDLELVDWPEHVKEVQRHWIGRDERADGTVEYRLRDWLFSRQRYWGEPIPVVHADDGEIVPLAEGDLPVELPEIDEYRPTDDGRPPLARAGDDWLRVTLPDGRRATRETNTMPQWAGSCWYYLRYLDPANEREIVAPELERYWLPVDLYVGGVEHAVLHLLYARFWHKVLYDCGVVSTPEPFQRLYNQGMVHYDAYRDDQGRYYHRDDVEERDGRLFAGGQELTVRLEKMSKSKLNVVNPDDVVDRYGADALRLYELFMGPLDQGNVWQTDGVEGTYRFLERVWRLVVDETTGELHPRLTDAPASSEPALERALHRTIKKTRDDVETLSFNTAIAQMMVFVNEATGSSTLPRTIVAAFVRVLAPFAPHLAEELWHRLGGAGLVAHASWPEHDEALCADDEVTVVVQVDGKKRAELRVAPDADRATLERLALGSPRVQELLEGKAPRKTVVVPGRLVNVVT